MADRIVIGNFLDEIYKTAEQRCSDEIEKIKKYREESLRKMKETAEIEAEHEYQDVYKRQPVQRQRLVLFVKQQKVERLAMSIQLLLLLQLVQKKDTLFTLV